MTDKILFFMNFTTKQCRSCMYCKLKCHSGGFECKIDDICKELPESLNCNRYIARLNEIETDSFLMNESNWS